MKQLKVLISAYSCRPGMGSEPGVGWNIAKEVAKHHDLWVLTRTDNRPSIEAELAENSIPGITFIYFDLPAAGWWKRGLLGVHLHHYIWQVKAYFVARQLHHEVGLDIAHHVTYVRYSSPSFLSLLPIPFIWGPVGGGESAPKPFWQDFYLGGKVYETLRGWARSLGEKDPFVRMTARRSYIAYATTEETAQRLRKIGASNVQILSQVGCSLDEITYLDQFSSSNQILTQFISVGRFLHWKGFHLGLRAFAQANLPKEIEFLIVGEGAEEKRLRSLALELGIEYQVKFLKEMPHEELLKKLGTCLALVHPSLHDSGGFVCMEAMALGCPVICLDLGGPSVQVTPKTGFKVAANDPEEAIQEIALAMVQLTRDSLLRRQMAEDAQWHVRENYSWQAKALLLSQIYQQSIKDKSMEQHTAV